MSCAHTEIPVDPLPCAEISRAAGFQGAARFRGNMVYDLLSLNIDGFSDESEISAKEDMQLDFECLTPLPVVVPMVGTMLNLTTLIMGKF